MTVEDEIVVLRTNNSDLNHELDKAHLVIAAMSDKLSLIAHTVRDVEDATANSCPHESTRNVDIRDGHGGFVTVQHCMDCGDPVGTTA